MITPDSAPADQASRRDRPPAQDEGAANGGGRDAARKRGDGGRGGNSRARRRSAKAIVALSHTVPTARPPTTSLSQCTSSSKREKPARIAPATAPAMSHVCRMDDPPRPA